MKMAYYKTRKATRSYGTRRPTQQQRNTGTATLTKAYNFAKSGNALAIAKAALKAATYMKGMINSEKNYFDTSQTGQAQSFSGTIYPLSQIPQGDDVGNRAGNSVLARSLYIKADISGNTGTVSGSTILRMMIVSDTENTGSTPTVSDILQTTGTALVVDSPLNVDHIARYNVLLDKTFALNNSGQIRLQYKKYIKLYKHLKYTGPNGTDVYKNNLYMLVCSDVNANDPSITFYSRLGFYDN